MRKVILIRHAEVDPKWKPICYGAMDVPLSAEGFFACAGLAGAVSNDLQPTAIYHSGLMRTKHLADLIGGFFATVSVTSDHRLRERNYGDWQGKTWDNVFQSDPDRFHDLIEDPDHYRPPGGETTTELQARVVEWFDDLCQIPSPSTIIAVSHSGPIAALAGHCLGLHARLWEPWTIGNLQAVEIVNSSRGKTVTRLPLLFDSMTDSH